MHPELKTVDGRGGDKGTDSFLGTINNQVTVFQFKHFPEQLTPQHWTKITGSLRTSYAKSKPQKWHLLISSEFTDPDWIRWDNLKKDYPDVELDVWLYSKLSSLILLRQEKLAVEFPELFLHVEVAKSLLKLINDKERTVQNYKPARFRGERGIFVGRKAQIDEIAKCFSESNEPVSIIGEGGSGKSALAFEAIHRIETTFDLIIDNYFGSDPDFASFLSDIARKLQLLSPEFTSLEVNDRIDYIKNFLAKFSRPLIYLDNYETISDALTLGGKQNNAIRINSFLEGIPKNTCILLTSRQRHNVDAERVINLTGLSLEESRTLFLRLTKNYFHGDPSESIIKAIDELSTKVNGHALSLELLARSYQGGQSSEIKNMANRLVNDLANPRTEENRLRSIRSCFDYSFNRLPPKHKKVLQRLIIFRSPFLERAANSITNSNNEAILNLYHRSFLQRINTDQYGNLEQPYWLYDFHPVIRKYLEGVNKKGHTPIKDHHKVKYWQFYSDLIREIFDGKYQNGDRNLVRVFQVGFRDSDNDYLRVLDSISDPSLTSEISNNLGMILEAEGMFDLSLKCHNKCLQIDESRGDFLRMANDYDHIGSISLVKGSHDDALKYQLEGLRLYKLLDDATNNANVRFILGVAGSLGNIGNTFFAKENLGEALKYQLEALKRHRNLDIGSRHTVKLFQSAVARDLGNIGNIFVKKSNLDHNVLTKSTDLDIAFDNYYQVYKIHLETQDYYGLGSSLHDISLVYMNRGDILGSLEWEQRSLEVNKDNFNQEGMAQNYKTIAKALTELDDIRGALDNYKEALLNTKDENVDRLVKIRNSINELISKLEDGTRY